MTFTGKRRPNGWRRRRPTPLPARPYLQTFGLENNIVRVSDIGAKRCYLEALSPDSEITVIMHDQRAMRYVSFVVKEHSTVVTYRFGEMRWSEAEHEWFTANNSIDYGEKQFTVAMQKAYREWTRQTRGF